MFLIVAVFFLGKPLFEMCCIHLGIAQIALDSPPPLCQMGTTEYFSGPNLFHLFFDITKMS